MQITAISTFSTTSNYIILKFCQITVLSFNVMTVVVVVSRGSQTYFTIPENRTKCSRSLQIDQMPDLTAL